MQPELEKIEIEPARRGDDDLTVDDRTIGDVGEEGVVQLGKVSIERPEIAALDEDLGLAAKHDCAKSIPLRLVQITAVRRKIVRKLREHRLDRRRDRKSGRPDSLRCKTEGGRRKLEGLLSS